MGMPSPPYIAPIAVDQSRKFGSPNTQSLMLSPAWLQWINALTTYVSGIPVTAGTTTHSNPLTNGAVLLGGGGSDIEPIASQGIPGQVLVSNGPGLPPSFATGGSAAGYDKSIQFNISGALSSSANFTYNPGTNTLTVLNIVAVGGSIDGTVIGGNTPKAGTFTNLSATALDANITLAERAFVRQVPAQQTPVDDAGIVLAGKIFGR